MTNIFKQRVIFLTISFFGLIGLVSSFYVINNSIITSSSSYQLNLADTTSLALANPVLRVERINNGIIYEIHYGTGTSKALAKEEIFNKNPVFLCWVVLILAMFTIATGAAGLYLLQMIDIIWGFKVKPLDVIMTLVLTALIILVMFYIESNIGGFYQITKIIEDFNILFKASCKGLPEQIAGMAILLTIPIVVTILLISPVCQGIQDGEEDLKKYTKVNTILMNSVQTLTVIIVFSVLTSSALGLSVKNQINIRETYFDVFPDRFGYIYGLLFSLFLAIVFVPVYIQLQNKKQELIEKLGQTAETGGLIEKLKKESSVIDNIKPMLMVGLPFISSFLPASLHLFKLK